MTVLWSHLGVRNASTCKSHHERKIFGARLSVALGKR